MGRNKLQPTKDKYYEINSLIISDLIKVLKVYSYDVKNR